jgi:DNA-binding transcriptional MerR regulator/methanogenic corrinoid protein MtbC1
MSGAEKSYKIGTVAKLTGLSTHALRIWEKRYGITSPKRAKGGGRLYSDAEVERFKRIKRLIDMGHAISQLAHLPLESLDELAQPTIGLSAAYDEAPLAPGTVASFLSAIHLLDLPRADRVLGHAAVSLEPRTLIDDVLVPIFTEVGDRWARGVLSVAEEHAATSVLRNQLGSLMRLFANEVGPGPVVSATLSGELHEFGALLAALTAAALGWRVVYLGTNLPAPQLANAARLASADVVMVSVVYHHPGAALSQLRAELPRAIDVVAGGAALRASDMKVAGLTILGSLGDLERWLTGRAAKSAVSRG